MLYDDQVQAIRAEENGQTEFGTADAVRGHILALTGSERRAEDAVLEWRKARADQGESIL